MQAATWRTRRCDSPASTGTRSRRYLCSKSDPRITQADRYGRTFETETYDTGGDTVANPEISVRYAFVDSPTLDLALDGRVYLPIDGDVGMMVAMPLAFHLSPSVRFDTGIYVPIIFSDPTQSVISFPFHLWLQADRLAVGPMTGVAIHNPGGSTSIPLGIGLSYGASADVDLRAWLLFPNVRGSGGGKTFGGGVGIQARF